MKDLKYRKKCNCKERERQKTEKYRNDLKNDKVVGHYISNTE
jgi:hypothetical protein